MAVIDPCRRATSAVGLAVAVVGDDGLEPPTLSV
jgi:hypothetical protein